MLVVNFFSRELKEIRVKVIQTPRRRAIEAERGASAKLGASSRLFM